MQVEKTKLFRIAISQKLQDVNEKTGRVLSALLQFGRASPKFPVKSENRLSINPRGTWFLRVHGRLKNDGK